VRAPRPHACRGLRFLDLLPNENEVGRPGPSKGPPAKTGPTASLTTTTTDRGGAGGAVEQQEDRNRRDPWRALSLFSRAGWARSGPHRAERETWQNNGAPAGTLGRGESAQQGRDDDVVFTSSREQGTTGKHTPGRSDATTKCARPTAEK
jgi:hypothetical protein